MSPRPLLLLAALLCLTSPAVGQEEELVAESAFSYTQESPDGRHVFVMIAPDEVECDAEDLAEGLVSVVRQRYAKSGLYKKGEPKTPLWTVDWFAPGVYVANDGVHLIRQGAAARSADDEALCFFASGKEIKRMAVRELVSAPYLLELGEEGLNWRRRDRFDAETGSYEVRTRFRERYRFDLTGALQESSRPLAFLAELLGALALLSWILALRSRKPVGPWGKAEPRRGGLLHVLVNGGMAVGMIFFLTWSRFLPVHGLFDEWGFMRIGLLASAILLTLPFTLVLRALDARLSPAAVATTPWIAAGAWTGVAAAVAAGRFVDLGPSSHLILTWDMAGGALIGGWIGLVLGLMRLGGDVGKRGAILAHSIGAIGLLGAFNLIYALVFRYLGIFVIGVTNGPSWQTETIAGYILDEGLAMGLIIALILVFGTRSFGLRDRRAALATSGAAAG